MRVFVLDKNKKTLDPCRPARARILLKQGKAKVLKRYPFTIIMQEKEVENCVTHEHQLKIDPGAKTTGIVIIQGSKVIWGAELTHRGFQIREVLTSRRQLRRSRRNRKTRYRQPRFLNRKRSEGWLAPSLMSRVENILTENPEGASPLILSMGLARTGIYSLTALEFCARMLTTIEDQISISRR